MRNVLSLIIVRNVMRLLSFNFYHSKLYFKIVVLMEKKTTKYIVEIVKVVLYALLGLLGGNALM